MRFAVLVYLSFDLLEQSIIQNPSGILPKNKFGSQDVIVSPKCPIWVLSRRTNISWMGPLFICSGDYAFLLYQIIFEEITLFFCLTKVLDI